MRYSDINLQYYLLIILFSSSCLISSTTLVVVCSNSSSSSSTPAVACKSTPYPKLCRSILAAFKSSPSDPYHYGKFTLKQCLKQARKLASALSGIPRRRSAMSDLELRALDDCSQLADLTVDDLEQVSGELSSVVDTALTGQLAEEVTTLLSGVVTNQQTCLDGLVDARSIFAVALGAPLNNITHLYSVSLGLVTEAVARNAKRYKGSPGKLSRIPAREPLETLIKVLRATTPYKNGSSHERTRTLGEMMVNGSGGGILVKQVVSVGPYESDNFTSISAAVASAPTRLKPEDGYFVIYAREGVYREYVLITKRKTNLMLIGDGISRTVITGNHNRADNWTTYNSSTFAVSGARFVAVDLTFRNTAGPEKHQAVAVRNTADFSSFYRCSFEGYQDTLYVHSLRQFYRECNVYGTVDFIFGNAAAVFQNCNLYARKALPGQKNTFTAQGRSDPNQNTGISIQNCKIEAASDLALNLSSNQNYLGRPWKPFSRTVFMQSRMGKLIAAAGWLEWNGTAGLDTLFYGEYGNYGPGADTGQRVSWAGYKIMNKAQAANFTVFNLTLGNTWLPDTDIPFNNGLF